MSVTPNESARALLERLKISGVDSAILVSGDWARAIPPQPMKAISLRHVPGFTPADSGTIRLFQSWKNGLVAIINPSRIGDGDPYLINFLKHCGVGSIILATSVLSLDAGVKPGSIVSVVDHLNLTGGKPAVVTEKLEMSDAYSTRLRSLISAVDPSILAEVVLAQTSRPKCETAAENRMARILGGDVLATEVALDVLVAKAAGVEVAGLAYVSDFAPGIRGHVYRRPEPSVKLLAILSGLVSVL